MENYTNFKIRKYIRHLNEENYYLDRAPHTIRAPPWRVVEK